MLTLSRDLPVPLYHQVKTSILRRIETGQWRPGDRLPSEDELAEGFKVSKITVRQALRELAQIGHIRREQGRGTFVQRPPLVEGPRKLTSFSEEMRRQGVQASSAVLEQGTRPGVRRRGLDARHRGGRTGLPPAPPPPRGRQSDGRADGLHPGPAGAAHRGHRLLALVALRRAQRPLQPRSRQRARDALRVRGRPARTRPCFTSTWGLR